MWINVIIAHFIFSFFFHWDGFGIVHVKCISGFNERMVNNKHQPKKNQFKKKLLWYRYKSFVNGCLYYYFQHFFPSREICKANLTSSRGLQIWDTFFWGGFSVSDRKCWISSAWIGICLKQIPEFRFRIVR